MMKSVMRSIMRWLAGLFHVEVVWIDKGQGRWVKRRCFHPFVRAAAAAVLVAGVSWGVLHFRSPGLSPDTAPGWTLPAPPRPPALPDGPPDSVSGERLGIHDFPDPGEPLPGPVPSSLSVDDDEYWVRINKGDYRLYLYRGGDVDKTYKVAVGKNPGDKTRAGDNRTPNGIFTVQSIEDARGWTHDFRDGKGVIKGAYGPWFIRLRTGWQGIGIHGTHDPESRGSMASEGCIRMLNEELEELKQFAFRDMKVVIEE